MIRLILRFIAEYFVFVVGLLFIFLLGIVYALLKLDGLASNIFFLLIALGWVAFLIRYFWELMEKKHKRQIISSEIEEASEELSAKEKTA